MTALDRPAPQCAENEQKILGLALAYERSDRGTSKCLDLLPTDFHFAVHQVIVQIVKAGEEPDVRAVARLLWQMGIKQDAQTVRDVIANVENHARVWLADGYEAERATMATFRKLAAVRQTIQLATELLSDCYDQDTSSDLHCFLQPYYDRLDRIAAEAEVLLWVPMR